jgi:hypothetical protein
MTLPGDFEIELYRISKGEPIRWSGLSSGEMERVQGYVIMGASAVMALVLAPDALVTLPELLKDIERSDGVDVAVIGLALFGWIGVAAALAVFWFGWRTAKTAGRLVWAVTSKRLIRMIGGEADRALSWTKADIMKVERMKLGETRAEGLVVTVRGDRPRRRRRNRTLLISGPLDLDAAERALAALED